MVSGTLRDQNADKSSILQRELHPSLQAEAPGLFHDQRKRNFLLVKANVYKCCFFSVWKKLNP